MTGPAAALGRTPQGGILRLVVPYKLLRLDPHALHDPIASLFGAAVADPLYALDTLGRTYPALASGPPELGPSGARVRLRRDLRTARNEPLTARDVLASLERARRRGAAALLGAFGQPSPVRNDPLAVDFPRAEPAQLAQTLASPLLAVLPKSFSPLEPDGTGAFTARFDKGTLTLSRNGNAARGPAFLDAIEVHTAVDLADALRAFESGAVDVGWLGSGLHRPRRGAVPFRGAHYGWAVLRTGRVGPWGAPGVAQRLLDGVDPSRLRHLGLEGLPRARDPGVAWGGGPTELHVLEDAPQLISIARTLAEALGRPGHELTVVLKSHPEIE
ncbi:MAG TPA: ABC transporter substrate-binding protein, partial [Polyangiaceae bacterium]